MTTSPRFKVSWYVWIRNHVTCEVASRRGPAVYWVRTRHIGDSTLCALVQEIQLELDQALWALAAGKAGGSP